MNPLWLKDILEWNKLPLVEKLEHLRKHYCTGPCGQSSSIQTTRSVTDETLKDVINLMRKGL